MPHDGSGPEPTPRSVGDGRLAVLIPVFADQEGLARSLESLRRERARFEVVVVDDGSEPPLVVPEGLPFAVRMLRLPHNQGITAALNAGLEQIVAAGFEYVARLDAGDLSLPGRFAAQVDFLDGHPDHAVIGSQVEVVDAAGRSLYRFHPPSDHQRILRRLRYENALSHPTVMMRVAALRDAGFYVDDYPGGEDYELWLRLARTWKLANLEQVYVRKELTPTSITGRRLKLALCRVRIQLDHFAPGSIHAYLGIARSLGALLLGRGAVIRLRRLHSRWTLGWPRVAKSR